MVADQTFFALRRSWNHDDVEHAMKSGVWSTQVDNEAIFTEAYDTARHVILLFSVNKSTAFQGYVCSPPLDQPIPTDLLCIAGINGIPLRPFLTQTTFLRETQLGHLARF
jgi:hypothetical protein